MPSKRSKKKQKKPSKPLPDLVGPDYIQILKGVILNKKVNLILCGESHEDAIDVTRSGGYFKPQHGWITTSLRTLAQDAATYAVVSMGPSVGKYKVLYRIYKKKKNLGSLVKAKEWSCGILKGDDGEDVEMDHDEDILLVWIRSGSSSKKGNAYVLSVTMKDFDEDGRIIEESCSSDDDDDDSDEDSDDDTQNQRSKKNIPNHDTFSSLDGDILEDISATLNKFVHKKLYETNNEPQDQNQNEQDSSNKYAFKNKEDAEIIILEWNDLDDVARELNRERILLTSSNENNKELSLVHHDEIIQKRKKDLQQNENIWTFDDWFCEMKNKSPVDHALHLILEGGIPPWELDLCREGNDATIPEAPDCIRCISEDSEGSSEDDFDPSMDGVGSYIDFVNRRFMDDIVSRWKDENLEFGSNNSWLHCVDSRDLGCDSARVSESYKEMWLNLLSPDERTMILEKKTNNVEENGLKPIWGMNPEDKELDRLKQNGLLEKDDSDSDDDSQSGSEIKSDHSHPTRKMNVDFDSISFPSFEGFFGQNTDILYYTPYVKAFYSPFLAKCVGSLPKWEQFFTHLFFGGTIPEAMNQLNLNETNNKFIHVRSPIQKTWDSKGNKYKLIERDDEEGNVTFPFFPFQCYLKAKGSEPSRTWSSFLFSKLTDSSSSSNECKSLSISARKWILESISTHSNDPKNSDDAEGGGEWFLAYLRANHRVIYDDIDRSDPAVLLQKKFMESEYGEHRKHNIGKISIPSCKVGFEDIARELATLDESNGVQQRKLISAHAETMSKILIDIWMSNLIDFATILKFIEIVANEKCDNVTVVCYMGSVHTKAVAKFFSTVVGLKRSLFVGEYNWDEDAARKLSLPTKLWNSEGFF